MKKIVDGRKALTKTQSTTRRFGVLTAALLLVAVHALTAQTREQLLRVPPTIAGTAVIDPAERLQLARADSEYPVTPGDVFQLTYLRAGEPVVTELTVENDYTINMNLFGSINATDITFTQLRPRIIATVSNALPQSLPAVSMVSVGVFRVRLLGAITQSQSVTAWGLSRLSDVARENLTSYSSIRSITISSRSGEQVEYDLFRALELGDETQDPRIRPGDTITFASAGRVVYIDGEVNQSGRVELAPEDTLADVVAYARGTTHRADLTRVRIHRTDDGTTITVSTRAIANDTFPDLRDGDIVTVPPRVRARPIVYVEGLVGAESDDLDALGAGALAAGSERMVVPIGIGETLHGLLERVAGSISPRVDLAGAELIRDEIPLTLPATMERILYDFSPELDVELQAFDRIVIPDEPGFVLITGGVNAPGLYPHLPGMNARAHIRLAGGFNREINTNERFLVIDADGNIKDEFATIEPEDHIEVLRNSFIYRFNRNFPIIASSIGFIATIVATITLFAP